MNELIANKIATLLAQLEELSTQELAWLSGYSWAKSQQSSVSSVVQEEPVTARKIQLLSASQTGNARSVAEKLQLSLKDHNIVAELSAVGDYKSKNISTEDVLIIITSTQGEGEPPEEAISLYKFLFGKKAPNLEQLSFAVLGLGDSSYPNYCQAAVDFDQQLVQLGATRLLDRVDCDLEYAPIAEKWIADITAVLSILATSSTAKTALGSGEQTLIQATEYYSKENPCEAVLSVRQKITADNANKDVEHIEIDLSDTGLNYQVGDALGVWYENDDQLITEIVDLCSVDKETEIILKDKQKTTLYQGLKHHAEISQNSSQFVKAYAHLLNNKELEQLIAENLQDYIDTTPLIGTIQQFPQQLNAQQLFDTFRALTPRMYSIASAAAEVGEEVHLTVGVVRYQYNEKTYTGGASGYLGQHIEEGDKLKVFVEANNQFRLPVDGHKPIIMIGAGTGIAPFRAFIQQREVNQDSGHNWLIFGNQNMTDDFLYQSEWLQYRQSGLLTRGDFAWSRQGKNKVYVQDKITEASADIWLWLEQGAYIYLCGDANNMAKDVESALLQVIKIQSNKDEEYAEEYLEQLREEKRYQRDVY